MRSILVTRPAGRDDPLVTILERAGYRVHAVPTVAIQPVLFDSGRLAGCDWIVVTSAHGVSALSDVPAGARLAAVGETTAGALRARGLEPAHIPASASGAALGSSLPEVAGKRVALLRASAAEDDLPRLLRGRGATVDEITVYRTVEGPEGSRAALRLALEDPALTAIVFASGSAIRGFLRLDGAPAWPAITIGPRTSAAAHKAGFTVMSEAAGQDVESLSHAVMAAIPPGERAHA